MADYFKASSCHILRSDCSTFHLHPCAAWSHDYTTAIEWALCGREQDWYDLALCTMRAVKCSLSLIHVDAITIGLVIEL